MNKTPKKYRKFIAGAVCPSCQQLDRMIIEPIEGADLERRLCVTCGYTDERPQATGLTVPQGAKDKSASNPNTTKEDQQSSPVRIIDP